MAIRKSDASPVSPPPEPRVLAERYELRDMLGHGGMAQVHRGWDRERLRACAIKLLADNLARDEDFRRRFQREAAAASALVHPRIVQVYEYSDADPTPYIVMEYVDGGTLRDFMRRQGPLPEATALRIAAEAADALAYAHARHVIHRDVKPANILLTSDGHVKVADFGIARTLDSTSHTRTGTVLGSTQYISPEQARGEPAGPPSDQYALGIVLYEALAGRLPFEPAETPVAMALKHLNEPPFDLQWLRPDVSGATVAVVRRLLAKSPKDRYATAAELAAALRRIYARVSSGEADTVVLGANAAPVAPAPAAGVAAAIARGATVRLAAHGRGHEARLTDTSRSPVLSSRYRRRTVLPQALVSLAALLAIWVIASLAYQTHRSAADARAVPSLIGQTVAAAQRLAAADQVGVTVSSTRQDPRVGDGLITAQDPPAGARLGKGGIIHVVVSAGSGVVPDVRGMPLAEAKQQLGAAGLRVGGMRYTYDPATPSGMIASQSAQPSAHVGASTPVDLVISQGPAPAPASPQPAPAASPQPAPAGSPQPAPAGSPQPPSSQPAPEPAPARSAPAQSAPAQPPASSGVVVPDLAGMPLAQAEEKLRAAGLQVGQISYTTDDRSAAGTVVSQSQAAGSHADSGTGVDLLVTQPSPSSPPPPTPQQSP
jgi:beta-lactam-binding protein with PASTA domain/predicted Ser/Thr protein kinase